MSEPTLHLFTNGTDHVSAKDVNDAWDVWCGITDERREDYDHDEETSFRQVSDEENLTIELEDEGPNGEEIPEGEVREYTLTAREWAAKGRGFLCSTEY